MGTPITGRGGGAGADDDHPDPPFGRPAGELRRTLRRAVGGGQKELVRDRKCLQDLDGLLHDGKIGIASHDDADDDFPFFLHTFFAPLNHPESLVDGSGPSGVKNAGEKSLSPPIPPIHGELPDSVGD
jgi:hypothetical protein